MRTLPGWVEKVHKAHKVKNVKSMQVRAICLCVVTLVILNGCSRDPQVRKRKYVDKGDAYLQKGKYNEAILEYANAIKIDPRYSLAHYHMAQTFLKMGQRNYAYQELSRAVEADPVNLKAQLDLAQLLLGAGESAQAREHVQAILKVEPKNAEAQVLLAYADAPTDLPKAIDEGKKAVEMDPSRSHSS